jgi:hypothetical protein
LLIFDLNKRETILPWPHAIRCDLKETGSNCKHALLALKKQTAMLRATHEGYHNKWSTALSIKPARKWRPPSYRNKQLTLSGLEKEP